MRVCAKPKVHIVMHRRGLALCPLFRGLDEICRKKRFNRLVIYYSRTAQPYLPVGTPNPFWQYCAYIILNPLPTRKP